MSLAVSKKGLTLKELLQRTSHRNAKVRKDALMGMKDLFLMYPEELKLNMHEVIQNYVDVLEMRIKCCFSALLVQDMPFIHLMMGYIFVAMANLAIEVRLMAFKFFYLIVQYYPAAFSLHGEKVLQNYADILQKNQFCLEDKGRLKNVLVGLLRCLSLLPSKKVEVDTFKKEVHRRVLHAYEPTRPTDFAGIAQHHVLIFLWVFVELHFAMPSFSFCIYGHDDDRYFSLNVVIAEIFLHLDEWIRPPAELLEKFLAFMEHALLDKIHGETRSGREKQMLTLVHFMPKLVAQVIGDWKSRLLQAFTKTFLDCKPESSVKLACLAAIEEMLFSRKGMWQPDGYDPEVVGPLITWIRELPVLLILLGDRHPSSSEAVLHLLLDLGRFASPGTFLAKEYDEVQKSLQEFYCTYQEGDKCYGPFTRLPLECQKLSIYSLAYFSHLDSPLLTSVTLCCLRPDLDEDVLFLIIEHLHSIFRRGKIEIQDHLSFFVTLVTRFNVFPENIRSAIEEGTKFSNRGTFKELIGVVFSCLEQMGDASLVLFLLEREILKQILLKPPLDNACAMLRILVRLDSKPTRLSEESIINLSNFIPSYLIDVVHNPKEAHFRTLMDYIVPCFYMFESSRKLLNLVLNGMGSMITESRINDIVSVLMLMLKDDKMNRIISSSRAEFDHVSHSIRSLKLEDSSLTVGERRRIQYALEQLKTVRSSLDQEMQRAKQDINKRVEGNEGPGSDVLTTPISKDLCLKPESRRSGKVLNKKRSYAQFHLDLGQSDFNFRTCSACGVKYAPGKKRMRRTIKHFTGITLTGFNTRNERVVHMPCSELGRIVLVLGSYSPAQRNKVYLFISSQRVAGCLVAEPIKEAFKVLPCSVDKRSDATKKNSKSDSTTLRFGEIKLQRETTKKAPTVNSLEVLDRKSNGAIVCEEKAVSAICGIRAIWVTPSNRRKRIAAQLLDAVRKSFCIGFTLQQSQIAFSPPKSAGKALAFSYTGTTSFMVYKPNAVDS
ncbi:hypothetical protein GH714_037626 [Hevea brasiliensis]|uniref:N-acetyltransferase domain-containing protein n=1 Tax=Hevea brasiliensis TaxID=3981 RepID=A0A6A6KMD8_HEVBR|nr:hypothetical protein GH714_037626 [Hevea brasiliensis]